MEKLSKISLIKLFTVPLVYFMAISSHAQDFHLSQYEASPMLINPAMTGMFKGDYRATLHYRSQWASIISNPFRSTALSVDTKIKELNAGAYLLHTSAGSGKYNTTNLVLSGAYDYRFGGSPHNHIAGGLQLGGIFKSIDFNSLTFEDQYSAANGGSFSNPTSETGGATSTLLPEVNLGFMYYYTNTKKRINPFLGASVLHLTQPNETLLNSSSKLPMRFNIHPGIKVNLNSKFQFLMHGILMKQENIKEVMFSWMGYYYMENKDAFATYGITRRTNDDAVIAHIGLKYKQLQYRLSYDVNTSNLQSISNSRGGFEISLIFISSKIDPTPIRSCPDL